jgi:hypothetical protein
MFISVSNMRAAFIAAFGLPVVLTMKVFAIPKKYSSVLCSAFVLMVIGTLPAAANILSSATATANCQGFSNLTVSATELTPGTTYTIDYSFSVGCNSGTPVTTTGSFTFTASSDTETVTVGSGPFSTTAMGSCGVSGTATLTSSG